MIDDDADQVLFASMKLLAERTSTADIFGGNVSANGVLGGTANAAPPLAIRVLSNGAGWILLLLTAFVLLQPSGRLGRLYASWKESKSRSLAIQREWPKLADRAAAFRPRTVLLVGSSFECAYCQMFADSLNRLYAKPDEAAVIFLNRIREGAPLTLRAATMMECARRRSAAVSVYRGIMSNRAVLSATLLDSVQAHSSALSDSAGVRCLASDEVRASIAADQRLLDSLDIKATPTFFVSSGEHIKGITSVAALRDLTH